MYKVAVFDDNLARRDGLQLLIDAMDQMKCVGAFPDCTDVVHRLRSNPPDVVLMDIGLPGMSGIDGIRRLREQAPQVRTLVRCGSSRKRSSNGS